MKYFFKAMELQYAQQISIWTYSEPYVIYSMDGSEETVNEFLNGQYFYALNDEQELVGYICSGKSAMFPGGYTSGIYDDDTYIDVGLGLRPDLTGKGIGYEFFNEGLAFLKQLHNTSKTRLVVLTFNERAIKVYERAGFKKGAKFLSEVNGRNEEFVCMTNDN